MNQDPQISNRELALPTAEQVSILDGRVLCVTKTKQPTLMKINLESRKLLEKSSN
jgi:hypothetical protein